MTAETIGEKLIYAAQKGSWQCTDGLFDTGVLASLHPGYDANRVCKINDAHLANAALYALLTESRLGGCIATVTGSAVVQV